MDNTQRELAEAAAGLTVEDFKYLQEHGILKPPAESSNANTQVTNTQSTEQEEEPERPGPPKKKRKRRTFHREWPDVGQILEADYEGVRYEAEVVTAPRYRTGKALKIVNGPAAGEVCHSPTGAMLQATEQQRQENNLGRKGVANGWQFWKVKGDGNGQST